MHRRTLDVLRCPACLAGSLVPEDEVASPAMIFGPVHCVGCRSRFAVAEGLLDAQPVVNHPPPLHSALQQPWIARGWERYVRPALHSLITLERSDREAEYGATKHLLGKIDGPLIDAGCGSGEFVQRFVREGVAAHVIGIDTSRTMLDEALAHVKENSLSADFVRAHLPPLPVLDHAIAAITANGLLHFIADDQLAALFAELARALRPRGRLVWSVLEKPRLALVGMHTHSEDTLREAASRAGFIQFERMNAGPMIVARVELP